MLLQSFLALFTPPRALEPPSLEQEFLDDYGRRSCSQRRVALLFGLAIWIGYIGWDVFHFVYNEAFEKAFYNVLVLRLIGVFFLGSYGFWVFRKGFEKESAATIDVCMALLGPYLLLLAMLVYVPFPLNFLYYFVGLIMVVLFAFGLMKLRSKPVLLLIATELAISIWVFMSADTGPTDGAIKGGHYYGWSATLYLTSFMLIGFVVTVELERAARDAFLRERELTEADKDTEAKTRALIAVKEDARSQAERENLNKSKFLAEAAHDLRQPMQALSNYLETLEHVLNCGDLERSSKLLGEAQSALRHTRGSFNAVLDLSRLESGFVTPEYSTFNILELIQISVSQLRGLAAERGAEVRIRRHAEDKIFVRTDRHLIDRALGNLVSNAIKYSDPAKTSKAGVLVGVVCFPNHVRLDVADNGIGIAKEHWGRIFQPFVQVREARDRASGVGLGLSITNAVISLLPEHRIDMSSRVGQGTRFSIQIPRADPILAPLVASNAEAVNLPDLAGAYAIYVEDDPLVRASTVALFEVSGVICEATASFEALRELLPTIERMPDVIITDYRLPNGKTARDVIQAIRSEFDEDIPAIIVTGEITGLEQESWIGDRDIVLSKPVDPGRLLSTVAQLTPAR